MNSIALSELTTRIEEAISLNFEQTIWIRAEISELRINNGHCYMELIEKSDESDTILAKCRANCWASTYRTLKPYFEQETGESLRAGMKVLVGVSVSFHSIYGLSLIVRDIDPVFTIGELAARRQQIIRQLEADGVLDMNKMHTIAQPAQRIAIISSKTAAGYDDFMNQLNGNPFNYVFYSRLVPAIMQGNGTENSVIAALDQIFKQAEKFDLVVIIRGGGATTDLAAFDSYLLALNCAQFPLPIIAGIGHQRDVSVVDIVAHSSVKTPTAAAEFLISNLQKAENKVDMLGDAIYSAIRNRIDEEERRLSEIRNNMRYVLKNSVLKKTHLLENYISRLPGLVRAQLKKEENRLRLIEKGIEAHSPAFLLQHGYSITSLNGKRLNSAKDLKERDKIKTYFADGTVESEVNKILNHKKQTQKP